ncbi:MAG: hypothetical protein JW732_03625 [Dehalococcoidia bacterium]|nr:hypothetical protein [Dehalococcoidia bacterium]
MTLTFYLGLEEMGLFIVEFNLESRSPVTVEDGDVIIDKGYSTVTVRNVEADSTNDAEIKARPKANAFLDELCQQYEINLEIGNGWTVMLQDSPETRHIRKYTIKTVIKGGHRRKIPRVLQEVEIRPSDAKTYYRKAAISRDTFDTFRNLYLAIENVASKIVASKGNSSQGELDLVRIALQECFSSNTELLKSHSRVYGFENTGDIFLDVATFLYKKNRVQLSHSKASKNKKIPFNSHDEWEVQVSLPLAEIVAKSLLSYEDTHLSA